MNNYAPPNAPVGDGDHRDKRMLKFLAVFFALYGLYCFYWTLRGWFWSGGISAAASMGTAVGLWLGYRWSRYLVYFFSTLILAYFLWSIWALMDMGWPYQDKVRSVVAVVPGGLVLMFGVGAAIYVYRAFRAES